MGCCVCLAAHLCMCSVTCCVLQSAAAAGCFAGVASKHAFGVWLVGMGRAVPYLLGCIALLVKQALLLAVLVLLAGGGAVSKVAHLLLLHALPPCTVQVQYLQPTHNSNNNVQVVQHAWNLLGVT